MTHQKKLGSQYIGPFVDGRALKQTLKTLRKVFPYRSCKTLPKKPCLWYQFDRCLAPCAGLTSTIEKEIKRNIQSLLKILQGKKSQVSKDLKREMKTASKNQGFEQAARIRDQIKALERVLSNAHVIKAVEARPQPDVLQKILKLEKPISRIEAYDVSNIQGKQATGSMVTFIKGLPDKNFYRKFKIKIQQKPNDAAMIKEILLRRFKHPEWGLPDLILIDGGKPQLSAAQKILKGKLPIIALAKKKNELFIEGNKKPILLKTLPRGTFNLILQLRDEAHRFALMYHKKLRRDSLLR